MKTLTINNMLVITGREGALLPGRLADNGTFHVQCLVKSRLWEVCLSWRQLGSVSEDSYSCNKALIISPQSGANCHNRANIRWNKRKKSFFESWERKMSELSHEVRNGHRILTIPDFKCNFARREANQAEGQQHQTSRVLSLSRVMCNVIWGHDYNQTLTITTYEGSLDEKVTTKADKDLTLYEILERWRKLIFLIIQAPWLKLLSEMMNDPFFSNSERLGALQSLIF